MKTSSQLVRDEDAEVEADDWLWPPPVGKTPREKKGVFCHLSLRDISVIKWQLVPVKCATSPVNGIGRPATHRRGDEPMMDRWMDGRLDGSRFSRSKSVWVVGRCANGNGPSAPRCSVSDEASLS